MEHYQSAPQFRPRPVKLSEAQHNALEIGDATSVVTRSVLTRPATSVNKAAIARPIRGAVSSVIVKSTVMIIAPVV
jgi:hypothetical protein